MDTALPVDRSAPSPLEPVSVVHADEPVRGVRHRRWRRLSAWRWLPTAFVVALTVAVLGFYGVSGSGHRPVRDLRRRGPGTAGRTAGPGFVLRFAHPGRGDRPRTGARLRPGGAGLHRRPRRRAPASRHGVADQHVCDLPGRSPAARALDRAGLVRRHPSGGHALSR